MCAAWPSHLWSFAHTTILCWSSLWISHPPTLSLSPSHSLLYFPPPHSQWLLNNSIIVLSPTHNMYMLVLAAIACICICSPSLPLSLSLSLSLFIPLSTSAYVSSLNFHQWSFLASTYMYMYLFLGACVMRRWWILGRHAQPDQPQEQQQQILYLAAARGQLHSSL